MFNWEDTKRMALQELKMKIAAAKKEMAEAETELQWEEAHRQFQQLMREFNGEFVDELTPQEDPDEFLNNLRNAGL